MFLAFGIDLVVTPAERAVQSAGPRASGGVSHSDHGQQAGLEGCHDRQGDERRPGPALHQASRLAYTGAASHLHDATRCKELHDCNT